MLQYDTEQFSIQVFLVTTNHFEVKCFLSEFCGQFSQMHANLCTVIKILWASVGKKNLFWKAYSIPLKMRYSSLHNCKYLVRK